eukprot:1177429-Prorocentrum_minimum.AAC.1
MPGWGRLSCYALGGVVCTLAVTGAGGPFKKKRSDLIRWRALLFIVRIARGTEGRRVRSASQSHAQRGHIGGIDTRSLGRQVEPAAVVSAEHIRHLGDGPRPQALADAGRGHPPRPPPLRAISALRSGRRDHAHDAHLQAVLSAQLPQQPRVPGSLRVASGVITKPIT